MTDEPLRPRLRPDSTVREHFNARYYVTAYIDLLGLSARFLELEAVVHGEDSEVLRAARKSIGQVVALRNSFESYYRAFDSPFEPAAWAQPLLGRADIRRLVEDTRHHESIFQYLSDCVVISVPLEPDHALRTWKGLFVMFSAVAAATVTLLAGQQVCRGGIEIGVSCEPYDGEILGASVVKAYNLERNIANVPRVVIGDELKSFVSRCPWIARSPEEAHVQHGYAALVREWLTTDSDGQTIIDFFSRGTAEALRSAGAGVALHRAREFVFDPRHREDPKNWPKYEWLRRYFESREAWLGVDSDPQST